MELKQKYQDNQDVKIDGYDYRITDVRDVKQGEQIVDFVYELEAHSGWEATEGELDKLISGELTLRELEEINDV